jgi:protein-S-isoprenylcysteine O-methyltransferase Ste14
VARGGGGYLDRSLENSRQPAERPQTTLKLGGLTLTGPWAILALLVLLGLVTAAVVWSHPSLKMSLSAALWIAFVVYWSAAARGAAPTQSSESARSRALHQNLMNGALLLLFIPVPGFRARFLPDAPFLVPVGLTFQAAFGLFAVWARRHLGRNWSGAITVAVDHQLVRTGPYRRIRHPIYTAMLGMFVGTAIVSGQMHALLAVVVIAFVYWRKIRLEETSLRQVFGTAYDAYVRESWALVPWVL